jgi:hypothetical protein
MIVLLALVGALVQPNPVLTPGVVRPMTRAAVCAVRWGLDHRHVTLRMRRAVFARYGVAWADRRHYEVDHLVPRELAGADDVLNLWPQPWPDARTKDHEENRLHQAVCAGALPLSVAQDRMRRWGRP